MATGKITKRLVDALKGGTTWDTEIRGFGVRVSGQTKSYVVSYRPKPGGKGMPKRWYKIGQHGSPWTPETARTEARRILALVAEGKDPALERRQERQEEGKTVAELIPAFLKSKAKLRSRDEMRRVMEKEIVRGKSDRLGIGRKRPVEVHRTHINAILDDVAERGPIMANRVRMYAIQFFEWAVDRGFIETNPSDRVKRRGVANNRERVLTNAELVEVWKAAESVGHPWGAIVKLLILTAQRRAEVAGMAWDEIDLHGAVWTIPARRAKNGREHQVPLAPEAVAILQGVKRIQGCPFVFTTDGNVAVSSYSAGKVKIDNAIRQARKAQNAKAKPMPHWTFHDLRRTATTGMAEMGIAPHIADAILNHKSGTIRGVAAVYNRAAYMPERKRALEAWAERVAALVSGKMVASNVVSIVKGSREA